VRLGLVGSLGRALPLTLDGDNAPGPDERVLELTQSEQHFTFTGVDEAPLLSVGRGFSAPAVFKVAQSPETRAHLMAHDPDSFNRWEAGQAAARTTMLAMMTGAGPDPLTIDAFGPVLDKALDDMAFAANMLSLPLERELAMAVDVVDPDAIHAARIGLVRAVAAAHHEKFAALYGQLGEQGPFSTDAKAAGKRALRNACLRFLTAEDDAEAVALAARHYAAATNMTDMIASLAALTRMVSRETEKALANFHDRFASDPLVLDKWMGLQAGSPRADTVDRVRDLMGHRAFDIKNPNRVRALIGAFAGNQLRFNAADGSGYALVGEIVRKLDGLNAQVAARMAGAFETWRRFDAKRQALMRGELEAMLATPGLSSNMFEVVSKMLAGPPG